MTVSKVVLVVEDDPIIRATIAQYLRQESWEVIEASSANEAMTALIAGDRRIQVAFVDFKLPGGPTGAMLAQWSEGQKPGLPILLTSGLASTHPESDCEPQRRFIAKPYELADIDRTLREMIESAS